MNIKLMKLSAMQKAKQKSISVMLCFVCTSFGWSCQIDDQKQDKETDSLYVKVEGTENYELKQFTIRKDHVILKCKSDDDAKALVNKPQFKTVYHAGFPWVLGIFNSKIGLDNLLRKTKADDATYGLNDIEDIILFPTNEIFVMCEKGQTPTAALDAAGLAEKLVEKELIDMWSNIYLIKLNVKLKDIFWVCRILHETKLCENAEPVFFRVGSFY